ncbi:MAG: hypothetical protein AABW75_01645 [Nanoarchaeota archaeon]
MANIVDLIYDNTVRNKIFANGSSISALRNPILGMIELASGLSPEISANLRMFGTATNFFATGQAIGFVRSYLEKKLGITFDSSREAKVWFNRLYGAACALGDVGISYGLYSFFGAKNIWEAGIPSVASVVLTSISGNTMLRAMDTFKDGLNLGINGGRSYFPRDMPKEEKKKYIDIINIASLGSLAIYYWGTR